jgi:hypothetical protein
MLHQAVGRADCRADVQRPAPARLVGGTADREPTQVYQLEAALDHFPNLIGRLESFQNDVYHGLSQRQRCRCRRQARLVTRQSVDGSNR